MVESGSWELNGIIVVLNLVNIDEILGFSRNYISLIRTRELLVIYYMAIIIYASLLTRYGIVIVKFV